ncbi:hypothetical protein GCM10023238_20040 [Streptomyces heliomycini]
MSRRVRRGGGGAPPVTGTSGTPRCSAPALVALLVNAARVQVLRADVYDSNPANRRAAIARYQQPRGDILVDGRPVTGSRDTGEHLRYDGRTARGRCTLR